MTAKRSSRANARDTGSKRANVGILMTAAWGASALGELELDAAVAGVGLFAVARIQRMKLTIAGRGQALWRDAQARAYLRWLLTSAT